MFSPLSALSPLDGRYRDKPGMDILRSFFSEHALNKYRLRVEIEWLKLLADCPEIVELQPFNVSQIQDLNHLVRDFDLVEAKKLKDIEKTTKHDVKAVEYYLRDKLTQKILINNTPEQHNSSSIWYGCSPEILEFIHFGCTSEDINNLAYALMLRDSRTTMIGFDVHNLIECLRRLAQNYMKVSMVSRTHGQLASGTTMGKEIMVFVTRLEEALKNVFNVQFKGKINGAVGNYNAHLVAYPKLCWLDMSRQMIQERLSLGAGSMLELTTQIESHDYLAQYFHAIIRMNTILIDLCQDLWGYISLGYFGLKMGGVDEVGSSTMPHKINPIDFENAEGNLGLANALLEHLARKLPTSRWQRDLTDSTLMRNIGVGIGYGVVAYQSLLQGLAKITISHQAIKKDLDQAWVLLAEPIQTMMRKHGLVGGYEQMKEVFRGDSEVTQEQVWQLIDSLVDLPEQARLDLKKLTPENYIGLADSW